MANEQGEFSLASSLRGGLRPLGHVIDGIEQLTPAWKHEHEETYQRIHDEFEKNRESDEAKKDAE